MTSQRSLIHIVEDDRDFRDSLVTLLTTTGFLTAEYDTAEAFLADWDLEWPGCVLLDLRLPGLSGLEVLQEIQARRRNQPVFLITGHGSIGVAVQAMKRGAEDVFTKPISPEVLLTRVRESVDIDRSRLQTYQNTAAARERLATLSPRERQVLEGIASGLTTKGIARDLGVSLKTAEAHRTNMMHKLGAHSVAQCLRYYLLTEGVAGVD